MKVYVQKYNILSKVTLYNLHYNYICNSAPNLLRLNSDSYYLQMRFPSPLDSYFAHLCIVMSSKCNIYDSYIYSYIVNIYAYAQIIYSKVATYFIYPFNM